MSSPHEEKYLECAAAYALGALDGDELREFEGHLQSGCSVCAAEVSSAREVVNILPLALPRSIISPDLKERIFFSARLATVARSHFEAQEEQHPDEIPLQVQEVSLPAPRRSWLTAGLSIAAVVMVVGFGFFINSLLNTIDHQNEFISKQKTQIMEFADELERKNAVLKVLQSRRIEIMTMDGMKVNPIGYGKIIWDPEQKMAILHVSHLPPVPSGMDYQLWMIKDNKSISAGVFAVVNEGQEESYFKVQPLDMADKNGVDEFAVTLEPKGGMPQPTGEIYLHGKALQN
jgi:anti-sigma-K factor RskA